MRITIARLSFAAALCGLATHADATDLRGMVGVAVTNGLARTPVGRQGISVTLAPAKPGAPARATTNAAGLYFFLGVAPGRYRLLVAGRQYPIAVTPASAQDIAPILLR